MAGPLPPIPRLIGTAIKEITFFAASLKYFCNLLFVFIELLDEHFL